MKQDILIKATVEVPDPIDTVFVVSVKGHGQWGRFKADDFWTCPEAFTDPQEARQFVNKIASFYFQSVAKEVEASRTSFNDRTEAFMNASAWEYSFGVTDGKAKRYSEMPFLVEYYIHQVPINRMGH